MMTSFGFATTGDEIVSTFAEQVGGRVFVITGPASDGLGAEVAITLARAPVPPAALVMVGRGTEERYAAVLHNIRSSDPTGTIDVRFYGGIDLYDLSSVRVGALKIYADWEERGIDVLINNAGVFGIPKLGFTADGIERHFGVNHIGHFLLTNKLMPLLLKTEKPRVVNVSSIGHAWAPGDFSDYNFERTPYTWRAAYGRSKLANIFFSRYLANVLGTRGLVSFSLHPGAIYTTNLFTELNEVEMIEFQEDVAENLGVRQKSIAQGSATILRAALDHELPLTNNGGYLSDCKISAIQGPGAHMSSGPEILWHISETLVNEKFQY